MQSFQFTNSLNVLFGNVQSIIVKFEKLSALKRRCMASLPSRYAALLARNSYSYAGHGVHQPWHPTVCWRPMRPAPVRFRSA